jgi:hypothetical protein
MMQNDVCVERPKKKSKAIHDICEEHSVHQQIAENMSSSSRRNEASEILSVDTKIMQGLSKSALRGIINLYKQTTNPNHKCESCNHILQGINDWVHLASSQDAVVWGLVSCLGSNVSCRRINTHESGCVSSHTTPPSISIHKDGEILCDCTNHLGDPPPTDKAFFPPPTSLKSVSSVTRLGDDTQWMWKRSTDGIVVIDDGDGTSWCVTNMSSTSVWDAFSEKCCPTGTVSGGDHAALLCALNYVGQDDYWPLRDCAFKRQQLIAT